LSEGPARRIMLPVNATHNGNGSSGDRPPDTLGQLLCANNIRSGSSEQEWVALLHAIVAGDQRALYELYERTHRLVFTLVVRITRDRATAEELTLDVFHDVWRRASRYDVTGGTVLGWIMNQARSRAIDRLRFERRKKRTAGYPKEPRVASVAPGADETVRGFERGRVLRRALTVLTPDERCAIERAFFSEMSYARVADSLNQPLGTIKTRIRSGLGKLRKALPAGAAEL